MSYYSSLYVCVHTYISWMLQPPKPPRRNVSFSSVRLSNFLCRSFRLSFFSSFFVCLSSYFPSWHSVGFRLSLSLDFGFSFSPSPHIHAWHARLSTNIQSHVLHESDDCYILRHFSLSIFCFSFLVYATATSSIKWTMSARSWRGVPCNVSTSSPPLLAYAFMAHAID